MSQGNQKDHHTDICPCFCSLWCGQAVRSQHSQMVRVYVSVCACVLVRVCLYAKKKKYESMSKQCEGILIHGSTLERPVIYCAIPRRRRKRRKRKEGGQGRSRTQFVIRHLYDLHKTTICLLILLTLQRGPIGQHLHSEMLHIRLATLQGDLSVAEAIC